MWHGVCCSEGAMTLIQMDSVQYKRRLARELAGQVDGFYVGGKRYRLARVKGADLQVRALGESQDWTVIDPMKDYPMDAYGRDICASLVA